MPSSQLFYCQLRAQSTSARVFILFWVRIVLSGLSLGVVLTSCGLRLDSPEDETAQDARKTVMVLGGVVGEQQEKLEAALAPFEEATGIDVVYEGTDAFTTLLPEWVALGAAPDVAMFPQPGLMADFARAGHLVPVTTFIERSDLEAAYSDDWLRLGSVDREIYGIWYRVTVKSLVWYNPQAFVDKGYRIPKTWDELMALSDRIVADGGTPWCLDMESGDATGWVGTDWIEDILLRAAGPQVYDQWISNQIPFNAAPVKQAFEYFGQVVLNPDYVAGGTLGVLSTPFGDSPQGLYGDPPRCYLLRQGSSLSGFFPKEVNVGQDAAVFPLPPIDPRYGTPILVAGDVFAMFHDTPEARALMQYLTTPRPHEIWAGLGGFISPHKQVGLNVYPNEVAKLQAEILINAQTIRFDASDLMPGVVGTDSFWTGVVQYVEGDDLDRILSTIEASWPQTPAE